MTPIRRTIGRAGRAIAFPATTSWSWWRSLEPTERVLWRGLALLAGGLSLVWLPAALIVPGVVLTAIALGFTFRRAAV
jgi:hypothetical protein